MRPTIASLRGRLRAARYSSTVDGADPGHLRIYDQRGRLVGEAVVRANQITYLQLGPYVAAKWPTDSYKTFRAKIHAYIQGNPST